MTIAAQVAAALTAAEAAFSEKKKELADVRAELSALKQNRASGEALSRMKPKEAKAGYEFRHAEDALVAARHQAALVKENAGALAPYDRALDAAHAADAELLAAAWAALDKLLQHRLVLAPKLDAAHAALGALPFAVRQTLNISLPDFGFGGDVNSRGALLRRLALLLDREAMADSLKNQGVQPNDKTIPAELLGKMEFYPHSSGGQFR